MQVRCLKAKTTLGDASDWDWNKQCLSRLLFSSVELAPRVIKPQVEGTKNRLSGLAF